MSAVPVLVLSSLSCLRLLNLLTRCGRPSRRVMSNIRLHVLAISVNASPAKNEEISFFKLARLLSKYALRRNDSAMASLRRAEAKVSERIRTRLLFEKTLLIGFRASSINLGTTSCFLQAVKNSILKSVLASFSGFFNVSASTC